MEAVRTSETSVDNNFTRQYIPEDNSERIYGLLDFWITLYKTTDEITLLRRLIFSAVRQDMETQKKQEVNGSESKSSNNCPSFISS
jgi:hypothetical protein